MQVKMQELEWDMEQYELIQNWERNTSRLYVVTLLNLYTEYIMGNAGLDEAQAGIKTAGGTINNFRYADDSTLMSEREEELKEPLDEGERGE